MQYLTLRDREPGWLLILWVLGILDLSSVKVNDSNLLPKYL